MPIELADGVTVYIDQPDVPTVRAEPPSSLTAVVPVAGPPGVDGPPGPTGPPGAVVGSSFRHTQITSLTVWTIVHGLGYNPAGIVAHDTTGAIIEPDDVTWPDVNSINLVFLSAVSGMAELS